MRWYYILVREREHPEDENAMLDISILLADPEDPDQVDEAVRTSLREMNLSPNDYVWSCDDVVDEDGDDG